MTLLLSIYGPKRGEVWVAEPVRDWIRVVPLRAPDGLHLRESVVEDACRKAAERHHQRWTAIRHAEGRQDRGLRDARHYAFHLLYEMKRANGLRAYSYPVIGRAFGMDHTTIMNGVRKTRLALSRLDPPARRLPVDNSEEAQQRTVLRHAGGQY